MLYKRAFRKEKEVVTSLIKDKMIKSAWNLRIEPRSYQSEATDWALAREQAVLSFSQLEVVTRSLRQGELSQTAIGTFRPAIPRYLVVCQTKELCVLQPLYVTHKE